MDDTAFIGEIRYFGFDYVPQDWFACDGRTVLIAQYTPLYAVIGVAYGGDGRTTFAVPNLIGRAAMAPLSPTYVRGAVYGEETVMLREAEMPLHTHQMVRPGGAKPYGQKLSTPNAKSAPGSLALASGATLNALIKTGQPDIELNPMAVTLAGGGQAHDNVQPYQVFTAGICYDGIFPPRP